MIFRHQRWHQLTKLAVVQLVQCGLWPLHLTQPLPKVQPLVGMNGPWLPYFQTFRNPVYSPKPSLPFRIWSTILKVPREGWPLLRSAARKKSRWPPCLSGGAICGDRLHSVGHGTNSPRDQGWSSTRPCPKSGNQVRSPWPPSCFPTSSRQCPRPFGPGYWGRSDWGQQDPWL